MIGADLARALDPARIGPDVGLELDDWQSALLRSDAKRILLNCSRQCGKSTVASLLAVNTVIEQPGSLVLMLSVSQRQSSELFRTMMSFARQVPGMPHIRAESALRCEWANGSRCLSLPGTERTSRGYAGADLVIIDEASRVPDDLLAAIRPTMATKSKARLIALSTPFGKRGWWYEAWISDDPSWMRIRVPASDCLRISKTFLEDERRSLGQKAFESEYCLIFHDADDQMFSDEMITRAFTSEVQPLWQ